MKYLIQALILENDSIMKANPKLEVESDFSPDGDKLFKNMIKIEKLKKLPVRLEVGFCICDNQIVREDKINYCAWCHKEIETK